MYRDLLLTSVRQRHKAFAGYRAFCIQLDVLNEVQGYTRQACLAHQVQRAVLIKIPTHVSIGLRSSVKTYCCR